MQAHESLPSMEDNTLLFMVDGTVLNIGGALREDRNNRDIRAEMSPSIGQIMGLLGHVIIIGCGGTGWHTAQLIALSNLASSISLIDGDILEESNLNRIPSVYAMLGQPKVTALAAEIARVRPSLAVIPYNAWLPIEPEDVANCLAPIAGQMSSTIIDCTDNPILQNNIVRAIEILNARLDEDIRHVRISYDGASHLTIKHHSTSRILDEQAGRYTDTPSWALPAQLAAILGVYSLLRHYFSHMSSVKELLPVAAIDDEYGGVLTPKKNRR